VRQPLPAASSRNRPGKVRRDVVPISSALQMFLIGPPRQLGGDLLDSEGQDGMPKNLLIPVGDVDEAKLAATDIEETYRHRRELASVTLSAQQPKAAKLRTTASTATPNSRGSGCG
jgi:hypothetical protein